MPYEISPLAEADLREIGDHIAQDNPRRAESFIDELLAQPEKIVAMPTACVAREDLAPGLRACAHQRYLIFFRMLGPRVRIERVLHGARDIDAVGFDD